ncbi:LysR substrate-binding domain-containing protein [Pectobacterium cacticida]|nr:LysR substrate-binding domain-containing protein [Pectobacterium cacticida]UYX07527.1 LysR substrate-binding domain-containing protein [Pectobacterium cacticida]
MRSLPPLNALVAFEAVARTGSVALAAEELFVTPGAVSRQIKVLDEFFETSLFEHQGRGLALSVAGAMYFKQITSHLEGIRKATAKLLNDGVRSIVRVHSYTTFATRWLIPRLSTFQVTHPQIEVRLTTSSDWGTGADCDASVRLGNGHWPGYESTKLVSNVLVLVCAPSLVQRSRPVDPVWLSEQTLLQVSSRSSDWDAWCRAVGVDPSTMSRQRVFESSAVAYEAAQDGLGVIVAQEVLIEAELASGRLIAPFDLRVDRDDETYYLVIDNARRRRRALIELREALCASETRNA